jgi:hypothetical protein
MNDNAIIAIIVTTVISISIALWVSASYFEAKAFNEVTGKHVTTSQAMFIQLRIQEPSK